MHEISKVAERKARLHIDLIDAAERRIARDGVTKLRARDLADDVGCSVGAIYNSFDDLDALIWYVSFRTLTNIEEVMDETGERFKDVEPVDCMVQLAWTYCDFVLENTKAWRSLFEHRPPADAPVPEWIEQGQDILFRHIEKPLSRYMPSACAIDLSLTSRMLFSSVHGVVDLALAQRASSLPLDALRKQTEFLVRTFVKGLQTG